MGAGDFAFAEEANRDAVRTRLAAFVGEKAEYYLGKWAQLLENHTGGGGFGAGFGAGFNWAAFFFTSGWLAYRKMYRLAIAVYAITLVELVLEDVVFVGVLGKSQPPSGVGTVANLLVAVICGAYGNRWYLSHALRAVAEHDCEGLPEDAWQAKLSAQGGTSLAAAIGLTVVSTVIGVAMLQLVPYLRR